jgi:hypothetical protein
VQFEFLLRFLLLHGFLLLFLGTVLAMGQVSLQLLLTADLFPLFVDCSHLTLQASFNKIEFPTLKQFLEFLSIKVARVLLLSAAVGWLGAVTIGFFVVEKHLFYLFFIFLCLRGTGLRSSLVLFLTTFWVLFIIQD